MRDVEVIRIQAKRPFAKTKIPGADYVLNLYIGCEHACRYCYAKFMCRFYPYGEWGKWVVVKENIPQLVKNRYVKGWVYMSSVSDAYQPIEKRLKLTRKTLENMDKRIKLSVLTKSPLILRDTDLFDQFKNVELGLTVNSFPDEFSRFAEPNAPPVSRRISALKDLKDSGFTTYAFISPVIPGLTDLEAIVKETEFVDFYWIEFLNWKAAGKEFRDFLISEYPEVMKNRDMDEIKRVLKGKSVRGVVIHDGGMRALRRFQSSSSQEAAGGGI